LEVLLCVDPNILEEVRSVPVNHKALESDNAEIDHRSQFLLVAGHDAAQQTNIDPQLVARRIDFDFERIHRRGYGDAVQRHVNDRRDTSYIRQVEVSVVTYRVISLLGKGS
jgi:hypothetical protein